MNIEAVTALAAAIAPVLIAFIRQPGMKPWLVRALAVGVPAVLTVVAILVVNGVSAADVLLEQAGIAVVAAQAVFTIFKDAGLDWIEYRTMVQPPIRDADGLGM